MDAVDSPPRVFPLNGHEKELGRALTLANIAITRKVNASNWIHIDPHLSTLVSTSAHNLAHNEVAPRRRCIASSAGLPAPTEHKGSGPHGPLPQLRRGGFGGEA